MSLAEGIAAGYFTSCGLWLVWSFVDSAIGHYTDPDEKTDEIIMVGVWPYLAAVRIKRWLSSRARASASRSPPRPPRRQPPA